MKTYDFDNKNILIVEDDEDVIKIYKTYLKNTNSNLFIFDLNPKTNLIEYIKENNISIVLMDIMLGKLNGYKLTKTIKSKLNIPVLSVTSLNKPEDMFKSLKSGADHHINKPFKKDMLLNGIKLFLNEI